MKRDCHEINFFVASRLTKRPLITIGRGVLPFLGIMLLCLMLVTYIPSISLLLPNLLLR
jgi:C4-dicarboxylate transporter DctM subunit